MWRLGFGVLFSCLTVLVACNPVSNDMSQTARKGEKSVYEINSPIGTSARELLREGNFQNVLIEIQAVEGYTPSQDAINYLQRFLEHYLERKPQDIRIVESDRIPTRSLREKDLFTVTDVREIESRFRRHRTKKGTLVIYYLFLNGKSADDQGKSRLLGQAHSNTSIVIYENTIRGLVEETQGASRAMAEATIMAHEMGHVLGLVNIDRASGAQHEDSRYPSHCMNPTCLMSRSAETQIFAGLAVPKLGPECETELKTLTSTPVAAQP